MAAVEIVRDENIVSRLVFEPTHIDGTTRQFLWTKIFEFPEAAGRAESLVWREKCVTDGDVNQLGCEQEREKRLRGRNVSYAGFTSTVAGHIRSINIGNNVSFSVIHVPDEGEWHLHIKVNSNTKLSKPEKADIRVKLENIFGPLVPQNCSGRT